MNYAAVSYLVFCKRYELNPFLNESKEDYQKYLDNLAALRS